MPSTEILAVLSDEVNEAAIVIGEHLAKMAVAADDDAFSDAVEQYCEQLRRLADVCQALNLAGLLDVCAFVERNVRQLRVGELDDRRQLLFERWLLPLLGYLKAPRDGVYITELSELLCRREWPTPLDADAAHALEQALLALDDAALAEMTAGPARQAVAQPDDVVVKIPDDVNPRLVDAFLTEGPQQANDYSSLIQRIARGEGWADELNECRRLVHALKGSANTVGVRGVATLCHHVEDILEYLAQRASMPKGELAKLLIKAADTLEMMFEGLLGTGEVPADALAVLQHVLDVANHLDHGDDLDIGDDVLGDIELTEAPSETSAADVAVGASASKISENVEPKVRVAARVIDELLRGSGEMAISAGHVRERLQHALKFVAELRERQTMLWDRSNDVEEFISTQGIVAGRRQALAVAGNVTTGFDPLEMDQYSELHTYVHELTETVADLQILGSRLIETLTAVDTAVNQQDLINSEVHELLMTARMLPASALESRLTRTVRQVAEQTQKQVRLVFQGADVKLDDQMVNVLIDPLQHLLRNAVDHGIELPAVRAELGKPETGLIELTFVRQGNYLVVTCRDDGAGIDLARIRALAAERGLIAADAEMSDAQAARLILQVGFSTADAVTEVSGRGVGMDIVHTSVAKLKGAIDIRTELGRGTSFILRMPMSLGIVHCLLAVAGHQTFALPTSNLERIVYDGAQFVTRVDGMWRYSDGEVNCPAESLTSLVGLSAVQGVGADERNRHVVLMNEADVRTAILVDTVTSGQDLVLKKLGRYLSGVVGTLGASILGDGSVVPILDLTELLLFERGEITAPQHAASLDDASAHADVLIVDDSLSVRTALATLLSEEGFRVRTAKDGIEAIEAIADARPAVVLADLEMPRMNGLELTAHIRADVAIRDLPVIMVTSRTAKKHRRQAQAAGVTDYITKPYQEGDLISRLRTILGKAA